jgi:hypothetical protein
LRSSALDGEARRSARAPQIRRIQPADALGEHVFAQRQDVVEVRHAQTREPVRGPERDLRRDVSHPAGQVSGTFGSRQEEAQRLGRLLRPKHDGRQAHFFTVVDRDTNDQEFAVRCQRFLAEQADAYRIVDAEGVLGEPDV